MKTRLADSVERRILDMVTFVDFLDNDMGFPVPACVQSLVSHTWSDILMQLKVIKADGREDNGGLRRRSVYIIIEFMGSEPDFEKGVRQT